MQRLRANVAYLASDELEGRMVGTRGLELAAEHIAGEFRAIGLRPPPERETYFQTFAAVAWTPATQPTTRPAVRKTRTQRVLSAIFGDDDEVVYPMQASVCDARNIIAYLPGRGPRVNEVIVIGAHYDHIGTRLRRPNAGPATTAPTRLILHGADDNASGTAAMLELARMFHKAEPLPRSLLFVAFSAEEQGLLGSRYFVQNPIVPLDRIVAMVNIDMLGRLRGDAVPVGGSGTCAAFPGILRDAAQRAGLKTTTFGDSGQGSSDQEHFVQKNIPVLFFNSGLHGDLHQPTDTADKINYPGEVRAVQMIADVIAAIAREPEIRFAQPTRPTSRPTTRRFR